MMIISNTIHVLVVLKPFLHILIIRDERKSYRNDTYQQMYFDLIMLRIAKFHMRIETKILDELNVFTTLFDKFDEYNSSDVTQLEDDDFLIINLKKWPRPPPRCRTAPRPCF